MATAAGKNIDSRRSVLQIMFRFLTGIVWVVAGLCLGIAMVLVSEEWKTLDNHHIFQTAIKELGFALVVSSTIWIVFEFGLRVRADSENDRRLRHIAESVFHAVLGLRIPRALSDEINRVGFEVSFIRDQMSATYTIREATYPLEAGRPEQPYIELTSEISFRVQNVTPDDRRFDIATALPNPLHAELRKRTRVLSIEAVKEYEAKPLKLNLKKAQADFEKSLEESKAQGIYDAGFVQLKPNERLTVTVRSVMAKEEEDSELLELAVPTDGLRVTVTDLVPGSRRVIRIRSVHREKFDAVSNDRGDPVTLNNPFWLLPHQGVLIWWQRKAPMRALAAPIAEQPA